MRKILFYSDAKHIGGHELQILNALKYLKQHFNIIFIVYSENIHFIELLKELDITIVEIRYSSNRFQTLRTFFSISHIANLCKIIKSIDPDLILNIQGNIELGSTMILAAKISKVKLISYIPICHFLSEVTNNGMIAKIKDLINLLYFKMIDGFITINDFNKNLIRKRGIKKPICVVPNGIEFDKYTIFDKREAKKILNINNNKINIALVGRVQFWHKGHDILISMVDKYREKLKNYQFLIVGIGEDFETLKLKIDELSLSKYFKILGHQKDLSLLYSAVDGIIIPSRFESGAGTPMVLLESIYYELPIIMTDLPGMENYLDKENLFEKENIDDLFEKLQNIIHSPIDKNRKERVVNMHDIQKFQLQFNQVLNGFLV